MLAMNRFVALEDEDFFNTTNKPRVLPNRAITKITAYAHVMPICIFLTSGGCGALVFVARKEIENNNLIM